MKLKKLAALALAGVTAFGMLTACGSGDSLANDSKATSPAGSKDGSADANTDNTDNTETVEEAPGAMSSKNVKLLGRTYFKDNVLWLGFSGTGVDFDYTGKDLDITVVGDMAAFGSADNQARVAVYVDGERVVDQMIDEGEKKLDVFTSDEAKTVNVKVIKLSEAAQSCCGLKPVELAEGETMAPAAAKTHRIEFIGDSITCGYGVDDEVKEHHFSTTTEDCTKSYSYKTAQKLDADYSLVSLSGYGIISGYSGDGKKVPEQTIPQYYDKLGYTWGGAFGEEKPSDIEWDFSSFEPEAIVINLGTNDASYAKKEELKKEYAAGYVDFIKQIREKNPNAKIFMTLGIMGQDLNLYMKQAYLDYTKETGDKNIAFFDLPVQNGNEDGYAADWHPTEATHEKASDALAAKIKEEMGW